MKKFLAKLNELQKMCLLSLCVGIVLMLFSLLPLFLANQSGWLIGIAIGTILGIINICLTYQGSEVALKTFKTYSFLLFFFLRAVLVIIALVVTAMFQFGFRTSADSYIVQPITAFNYSLWGFLIGYILMKIVMIIAMAKSKKNDVTISDNLHKEKDDKDGQSNQ